MTAIEAGSMLKISTPYFGVITNGDRMKDPLLDSSTPTYDIEDLAEIGNFTREIPNLRDLMRFIASSSQAQETAAKTLTPAKDGETSKDDPSSIYGGLWTFNNLPLDLIEKKYGVRLTPEWIQQVLLASVRFPHGSGSFISPDGLAITNHHVGEKFVKDLSTKDHDYIKNGFYARTREEELKCPGLEIRELREIVDVTKEVNSAFTPEMTPEQALDAQKKRIASLEREFSERTGLRSEVVNLYSGGKFDMYQYKIYDDVRLKFAPHFDVAFYGGDPANFTYPRTDLDICIFRVYENGKPIQSPAFFQISSKGAEEGDLIFCSGHPGSTGRLLTMDQLSYLRDISYPYHLERLAKERALLSEFSKRSPEHGLVAHDELFSTENSLKAIGGYLAGLQDQDLMGKKAAEDARLRDDIAQDPELQSKTGNSWEEIKKAQAQRVALLKHYDNFEVGRGFWSDYFEMARNLVRMAEEKTKPDEERLKEFSVTKLPSLLQETLASPPIASSPIYDDLEILKLTHSLKRLQEECGSEEIVQKIFQGRSAEEVAREAISGTKLKDPQERQKYVDGGLDAIQKSEDPMIRLALLVDPYSRKIRKEFEDKVESVETKYGGLIANALFKLRGTLIPPDATFSLRLSFAPVAGYEEDGKQVPYHTTFADLYRLAEEHGNQPPWQLPEIFLQKKSAVNLETPLNFVSPLDHIGGNSGSPGIEAVLDKDGKLLPVFVGILFDGNIHSLATRWGYEEKQNRAVMVDSRGILEALTRIYDAKDLVAELTGGGSDQKDASTESHSQTPVWYGKEIRQ